MGIKALNLNAVERFVSKYDHGYRENGNHTQGATVWLLGCLTASQMSILKDDVASFSESGKMSLRSSENDVLAARMALRGWENYEVEFEAKRGQINGREMSLVSEDGLNTIPLEVLREIGQHVKEANSLSKSAEKNSGSGSSGSSSSKSANVKSAPKKAKTDGAATPSAE